MCSCHNRMQATGMVNDHMTSCFRYGVDVGE
ncbi:DNA-3-methyladenine glycosylase I [Enterovibrio calviensis]